MAIEIDFGRDLGAVAFPDDVSEEQAQQYVRDNYQAIRKSLIEQRQEELAAETEREEKAKFQLGQYGMVETALNTLSELPRGALEGIGQTLKGVARLPSAIPGPTYDPYTEVPLEQDPLYRAGQAVQEFGQETYPGLPGVRETVPAQIMAGIGSTVSTLPAAVIAGPVGAAVSYGLQSGESAAEEADTTINRRIAEALANRQYDLAADLQDSREQKKNLAFITTAPIGAATEGLLGAAPKIVKRFATGRIGGIGERLAERLVPQSARYQRRFLGVTGAERVRGAVEALATEGVQESAEQLGGNIAAAAVYDPERGWLDGVAQAGFIGAASGGIVGGLVGSRPNAKLANAAAESLGGDPTNPLPRANATVAGIEDTQQEGEAEITAEDVLKMSQETGVAGQEEVVTPTPTPKVKPAPAASEVDVVRLDQLRLKADAGTINPEELAELTVMHQKMGIPDPVVGKAPAPEPPPTPAAPVDTETGLTADEQDELDQLITAEDAGLLSEEGAITLAAYRSRLGFPAQPQAPTPSAVQEQGPDEGVLRREEPQPAVEVELRQVDQGGRPSEVGGAEAEVTPEEVQQVKAEVVPAPAPTPVPTPAPATTTAAKTANELAGDLALLRAQKPRPLSKLYGPNPTEKQKAAHKAAMSDWEKQYRKLAQLQKRTLEQEKANPTAKVREASPGEQAQPPAAAATPMQEGINNLKFVSEPVAKVRGGGMDPKDAKAKLVQQLERAVEAAPDASDPDSQVPKVTIEIPGDGTYTVANTKQALNQVLDKARKLNTSMAKGPVKAPAARQKAERPKEALMRMAKEAVQVYGKNAAAKLREQANNADLDLTDEQRNELKVVADMLPDTVEAALQKVIAATDPRGKAFEAVAALSNFVVFQASKIALRIYQATKSWVAARNAGMDYIKSHVQLQNEPETAANFEEHIKAFPNQEIPAGTPERPQPPSPAERVESRGLFLGEIEKDTDENWASEARKWVDFFNGNLERAYQVVLTADIDNAFKEYILGEIIQRNQLDIARAKGDVEVMRALNLEKRLADSAKSLGAITAKAMAARKLAQERFWWAQPAMILRNLIRKRQDELIPFSKIESEQVRKWLTESGREAVNQIREAMKKADNVFAREFRKIKQVPGEPDGPPIEIKWQDILTQALDTQGSVRQKMLQVILADPRLRNLSPAGIAEITNLLTTAWETKRNQIFRAEFQKKVPLPNVKPDVREKLFRSLPRILKYANIARATPGSFSIQDGPDTSLLWEQAFRDAVAPEFGVAEINGVTARKITDLAQKAQAAQGVNRNEIIQQMFRLMAREGGVRFSDVLRDYWYAAVLSGIRTQVDNAMNVFNGFLNTAMFATMAKKDAGFIAYSALKGLDEGIRDFWPMLWRGELYRSVNFNPDQPGSALEGLGESRNLFAKGISQFKYVSRLINALDHMTALMSDSTAKAYALRKLYDADVARRYLTPSPEVVAAARARAIAEGTRPELVNKRTREIIQEKLPVDILMTSREIREMTTFTETPQGLLGSLYRGLDQAAQGKTLYKVLSGTNFLRFAANSANEILNFALPVALYRYYQSAPGKSEGEYGLKFSESRRDLILAKAAFGTALGIFAGALFLGDDDKEEDRNIDITGSFKSLDPNKRKQLLAEGRQPYSIRFGNTYVSYRQLGFGGVLATIGELRDRQLFSPDKWSQENIVEKVLDGAAAGMFIVKDSTAISGLTELLGFANAYKYDTDEFIEKSFPRYVSRLAGSLVPNILKEVDAWSDPSIFKTEAGNLGYEYFLQQVPFGRREIGPGPILNVLGEPVKVERYPWSRWAKEREDDLAWGTLGKLASRGVFMPTPAITVKVNENGTRREMTREEKYQYQQAVGQGYRKFIEQNSKRLLALPPAEAADFIDKNADRIRRNARTNLKNSF
jgi:hypothetical protein